MKKSFTFEITRPEKYKGRMPYIKGKARPRVVKGGWAYSPKSPFERDLTLQLGLYKDCELLDGWNKNSVFSLEITCYFELPKNASKKRQAEKAGGYYSKKPDFDNIAKVVADCLVKAKIIEDDNAIVKCSIEKFYQNFKDERETLSLTLTDLNS